MVFFQLSSLPRILGFEQTNPTPIYIDNESALKIINHNTSPTEQTCHMDLRFFAIQDWRQKGEVTLRHISGVINPADDLTNLLGKQCLRCHICIYLCESETTRQA